MKPTDPPPPAAPPPVGLASPVALVIIPNDYLSPHGFNVTEFSDLYRATSFYESVPYMDPVLVIVKNWTVAP